MKDLGEVSEDFLNKHVETLVTVLSIGAFLILLGSIFARTPDLFDKTVDFFSEFTLTKIPNTGIPLPAPSSPGAHRILYGTVAGFSLSWGIFQIVILGLRFLARSPLGRKTETLTNIVFLFSFNYLIRNFLKRTVDLSAWFSFWALVLVLIGVTLIIRGLVILAQRWLR